MDKETIEEVLYNLIEFGKNDSHVEVLVDNIVFRAIFHLWTLYNEQQKEIEKLKGARNWYFEHFSSEACTPEQLRKIMKYEYVEKDKIKAKIKELEKEIEEKQEHCLDFTLMSEHEIDTNAIIETLKELLGE